MGSSKEHCCSTTAQRTAAGQSTAAALQDRVACILLSTYRGTGAWDGHMQLLGETEAGLKAKLSTAETDEAGGCRGAPGA